MMMPRGTTIQLPRSTILSVVSLCATGGQIAHKNFSLTVYYGFGCTIVTAGPKLPIAAEFTDAKRAKQETAMRVTCDALAVEQPIWMVGDGAYDLLEWHDHLLEAGVVPIAPYNPRNTDEPLDIEYRVEAPNQRVQRRRSAEAIDLGGDVRPAITGRTDDWSL
jgi:hypothetical protein